MAKDEHARDFGPDQTREEPLATPDQKKGAAVGRRKFGLHKGKIRILDGFDDPLPEFDPYC